jgi:YjjG family noncanonical pyrimidine nucleotidase
MTFERVRPTETIELRGRKFAAEGTGMPYTTFLLDLDHTLFDSDTSEQVAFEQTLADVGVAEPGRHFDAYRSINRELWAAVESGHLSPQQVRTRRFERLVAEECIDGDPQQMAHDFVSGLGAHGELYEGALDVLDRLSRDASLALVTNGLSEVQRRRIERLGIEDYFDAVVISAEVGTAKPGKEIFNIVFDALDSPPKKSSVMVGDNLSSDIQGGANYGIATCWYNPGGQSAERTTHVVHEIANLQELLGFVAD